MDTISTCAVNYERMAVNYKIFHGWDRISTITRFFWGCVLGIICILRMAVNYDLILVGFTYGVSELWIL